MKILVTGSTGFIGYEVSCQLSRMGLKPKLLVKRYERGKLLSKLDAEIIEGDLTEISSLNNALEGVDAVIHLGARATFEKYKKIKDVNVTATYNLFEQCMKAGVGNFVFGSSMFVYSGGSAVIDRNTDANPLIDYGRAKLEVENRLLDISKDKDINVAAVRLPHVYGTQNLLFGQIRRGFIICPGNGKNIFSHLHVNDAARILIEIALRGWTGVSPAGDNSPSTWNEFFQVIQQHFPKIRVYRIPENISYIGSRIIDLFYDFLDRPNIYTPDTVTGFNLDLAIKPGLLWNDLGISPEYPTIKEGIPKVLDGFIPYRWVHSIKDKHRLM